MSFDDALTIVLDKDGLAMKTQTMAGYISRIATTSPDYDFCIAFRYRGRPLTGTRQCPVFPATLDDNGDVVAGNPDVPAVCTEGVPFNEELVRHLFEDDWYTCTVAECEDALSKMTTTP